MTDSNYSRVMNRRMDENFGAPMYHGAGSSSDRLYGKQF